MTAILDQFFLSSNSAWWVAGTREADGSLTDGTGGGRHMLLPGGTADPVLLDHTGTDYFWLPGTAGNNLTVPGLSNSTAYDYKVVYEDATTATGQETTDGSGNLVLGETHPNFDTKKVARVRVVADGDDVDAATAVADLLASDADPDATTFTEASSNAATVTINRSLSGYVTQVVQSDRYIASTDDYLSATDDAVLDVGASEPFTAVWVGTLHADQQAVLIGKRLHLVNASAGWAIFQNNGGFLTYSLSDGLTEVQAAANTYDFDSSDADKLNTRITVAVGRDASDFPFAYVIDTRSTDASTLAGSLANSQSLHLLGGFYYGDLSLEGAAFTKQALTDAQISDVADALILRNQGIYTLACGSGSMAVTGTAATLTYTVVTSSRTLAVTARIHQAINEVFG